MSMQTKFLLDESQMPRFWYNIQADLPKPAPAVLHPGTLQPVGPDDLAPLFPMALIQQEVSQEREIEIPEPVRDVFRLWRPAPDVPRPPAWKRRWAPRPRFITNTKASAPLAATSPTRRCRRRFTTRRPASKRLVTETGAGQWGTSLSFAGSLYGLQVEVYQVRVSYDQKPYRRAVMETYGARCVASPSNETVFGRSVLAKDPNHPGSLGIAISEAVELAVQRDDTKYALGSVLNHVLLHQTIIGQEAMEQMKMANAGPMW
jgi:tryptophan synthase beta chain